MNNTTHIIERFFINVNTSNEETAYSIKDNISLFIKNELFPRLELLFDSYNMEESIIRFNEININISVDNWNNYERIKYEIINQIEEKFERHIQQNFKTKKRINTSYEGDTTDIQKISLNKNLKSTFIFFLENGYLPWSANEENFIESTTSRNWNNSLKETVFVDNLKKLVVKDSVASDRFIYQFSNEVIISFLVKIYPKLGEFKKRLLSFLGEPEDKTRYLFLKLLFQICTSAEIETILNSLKLFFIQHRKGESLYSSKSKSTNISDVIKIIRDVIPEKIANDIPFLKIYKTSLIKFQSPKEINSSTIKIKEPANTEIIFEDYEIAENENELSFFEKESKDIAVINTGLILLHPFLKYFFIETGIADKNGNLIKEMLDLAIQSLHFIATGKENVFEGNLVLEKFICGVPLKRSVQKQSLLTDKIKNEAVVLLKEVIKNWPALKNTSAGGLREMFINRDGKLIQKENKYKLLVERKAQDVLLEKLQWNISIVKLPWKKELIIVEW